jgi:hypothetical protein
MGKRDYRHREPKKTKKSAKKLTSESLISPPTPTTVEVIKKGKKEPETED